jgi:hypothetical protein
MQLSNFDSVLYKSFLLSSTRPKYSWTQILLQLCPLHSIACFQANNKWEHNCPLHAGRAPPKCRSSYNDYSRAIGSPVDRVVSPFLLNKALRSQMRQRNWEKSRRDPSPLSGVRKISNEEFDNHQPAYAETVIERETHGGGSGP